MGDIRALIVDDEPLARRGVRQLLEPHGDVRVVGEATNGREAVELIRTLAPDLLFLDVQMPELGGFDLLAGRDAGALPVVIFLTAYEEYARRAFDVEAVDYLVKPAERSRFEAALRRARREIARRRGEEDDERMGGILVQTKAGEHILQPAEIDWVEAADYYATVHAGGRRFLIRTSLNALEQQLAEPLFMRVHRSAIVNLARVRSVLDEGEGSGTLVLRSGAEVPVSRRNRGKVRAWLAERMA